MKQYLLLLRSADFNKSDNLWTSSAINLYSNDYYKNYSYSRSKYGLNLLGDNTYTGIELASPSVTGENATPLLNNAIYVTDAGEVIEDEATPGLLRFIDTSSRVDVLAYKHAFTNVAGTQVPTFNLQVYESDEEDGPWLKSRLSFDSNIIFIRDSKPWIKIELEIFTENEDVSNLGLLFYLEIGIHEATYPTISTNTKNVLRRFPTWTALFEDSEDDATPNLATPSSFGGKFLSALLQDSIDQYVSKIDLLDINNYIASADENMLAWIYVSYNIPVNLLTVIGDGVALATVHSLDDFYSLKETDHAYYYNPIDKQILTIRQYQNLIVNDGLVEQYPISVFNNFDEFGVRVGLPRLFLESNSRYKKRILDVSRNLPGVYKEAIQRTLRRELDIWKVYGATPDSEYLGATPEIIEISDIESSTPYFTDSGKPLQPFKNLILDLNKRYPTNLGYVRWEEGIWDYAGMENAGIGTIPAIYDVGSSPLGTYYQPGVNDFSDARFILEAEDQSTISFDGYAQISGTYISGTSEYYNPIKLDYLSYITFEIEKPNGNSGVTYPGLATPVGVGLTYEITTKPHGDYATPLNFYTNLNYIYRDDFYVRNLHSDQHSASPEFNLIKIFDQEGNTIDSIEFRDKTNNDLYINSSSPNSSSIGLNDINNIKVVFSNGGWNYISQSYDNTLPQASHWIQFDSTTPQYRKHPEYGTSIEVASPYINEQNVNLKIGSTIYEYNTVTLQSDSILSTVYLNELNSIGEESLSTPILYTSDILNSIIYPPSATPKFLYVNSSKPSGLTLYGEQQSTPGISGGLVTDLVDDAQYLVPSSPNILYSFYNNSGTPINSPDYFESATIDFSSTPYYIKLESASSNFYPLYRNQYSAFTAQTTPIFSGFIDSLDNVYETEEQYLISYFNSDTFLKSIYLDSELFNLNSDYTYNINDINFLTETDHINLFVEDKETLISDFNFAIANGTAIVADVHAKKDNYEIMQARSAIHTGRVYLNEKDYYIYSQDNTDSATGRYFSIQLTETPKNGSPIIVNVEDSIYRNIAFEDSATPGKLSFYNTEIVTGNFGNSLYLAYEDLSEISITDNLTGQILFSDLSTSHNFIECFSEATPATIGREYQVSYKVNNAWHLDNYVYNVNDDKYYSEIYFSSTPNINKVYHITYETSSTDNTQTVDIDLNSSVNPLDEGYIYMSKNEYNFSHIDKYLSPKYISDSSSDLMYLSIISYDENNNPKPGQTFYISGDLISATPAYITTNDNGVGKGIIRYSDIHPSEFSSGTINITGIGSATPNGEINSQTSGYVDQINFSIRKTQPKKLTLQAAPTDLIINADAISTVGVSGKILWNNNLFKHSVLLSWNKARTLKDLFATSSDTFMSNSDGTFQLDNIITSQEAATPGYWFVRISVDDSENIRNLLQSDGETLTEFDVTIAGDVIYWYESYDPIQYDNEGDIPLPNIYTVSKQENSDLIATPNFVYKHSDSALIYSLDSTPNWNLPTWVHLNKFTQYQMGLFGTTPNIISDYSLIHPDYEE